ncbi:MAG: zinc-binding dehydrogenase [Hyphomonas sp.]|uniref:zinc-binding dehydrogenase n=1 Tax=Hyphomonas sp. TaxID=87 RepID=UPI003001BA29
MASNVPSKGLQLRSHVKSGGELELSLVEVDIPAPGPDDVIVRVEATPINPSDLGLLLGAADMSSAKASGTADRPVVTAKVPAAGMRAMAPRVDESMPVGNEGAGTVVAAGSSPAAQALLGKTVAGLGGEMYSHYRTLNVAQCMELPEGATARDGASCFVNPLTSLAMTEVMRMEGHKALLHTAAASNLGQMLNKICIADGIDLVNVVRSDAQEKILRDIGAKHVVNSTSLGFMNDLIQALATTGATLGFDAIGGGGLAGQILVAMEAAANMNAKEYSRYGSATHKQVYIYGRLDMSPTTLPPGVGMAWGVGGFLLTPFLQKVGAEGRAKLRARVGKELKTTFASHYTSEISLAEALQLPVIEAYNRRATGEKYLINPSK